MKLTFTPPPDSVIHRYCWNCRADGATEITAARQRLYHCASCGQTHPRALVIDPAVKWWLDDTQEYWHEVAGVFVRNPNGQFLFFERTAYPFGLTPPAGHIDVGEAPKEAAARELYEEVGLRAQYLVPIGTDDIVGDECRRGADTHVWHTFGLTVPASASIRLDKEGLRPVWLSLTEAATCELTFSTRFVIARHSDALNRLV